MRLLIFLVQKYVDVSATLRGANDNPKIYWRHWSPGRLAEAESSNAMQPGHAASRGSFQW